jgi:hypothetical protein
MKIIIIIVIIISCCALGMRRGGNALAWRLALGFIMWITDCVPVDGTSTIWYRISGIIFRRVYYVVGGSPSWRFTVQQQVDKLLYMEGGGNSVENEILIKYRRKIGQLLLSLQKVCRVYTSMYMYTDTRKKFILPVIGLGKHYCRR